LVTVNTLQSFVHAFRLPATCNKGVTNDGCLAVLIENAPAKQRWKLNMRHVHRTMRSS